MLTVKLTRKSESELSPVISLWGVVSGHGGLRGSTVRNETRHPLVWICGITGVFDRLSLRLLSQTRCAT